MTALRAAETCERARVSLVAAATAAAAASAAAGWRAEGFGAAASSGGTEDAELDGGLFAGALGASDLLLLVDYNFLEFGLAVVADVFVDGHFVPRTVIDYREIPLKSFPPAGECFLEPTVPDQTCRAWEL